MWVVIFFEQKTAYEMRISDWSSDVCSSDPPAELGDVYIRRHTAGALCGRRFLPQIRVRPVVERTILPPPDHKGWDLAPHKGAGCLHLSGFPAIRRWAALQSRARARSEEHTSELQSLMRISYAVFCLKKINI